MRLTLSRHGGFAGIRMPPMVVDTTKLPALIGSNIERLVNAAPAPSAIPPAPPTQPDRFCFTLVVARDDGTESTYVFDESTASASLKALVTTIQAAAKR
jgi:hypothetical protein